MILGSTLVLALVAAGLGTLLHWLIVRVGGPEMVAFWLGLALALYLFAIGPVVIGR